MTGARKFALWLAPVAAVCGTLAVSTGTASANVNVVTAIHQQDSVVSSSAELERLKHLKVTDRADARKLIAPLEKLARKFHHAADVVSASSADSAGQRTGRRDWVTAVRGLATGFGTLAHALREVASGNETGAATLLRTAERHVKAGEALGDRADRLLDIRSGD